MITNSNNISNTNYDIDDTLFCEKCLSESIPRPHYHVTLLNDRYYCPIHDDICSYCNSPNHSTKRCPFVKIKLISLDNHREECVFAGKIRKNTKYQMINKNNKRDKNKKPIEVYDIADELSNMIINRKKSIRWFDDEMQ